MLERFKKAYAANVARGRDAVFVFDGNEFVVAYARYLIEYLDSKLGGAK